MPVSSDEVELAKTILVTHGYQRGKTLGEVLNTPKGQASLTWLRDNCGECSDGAGAAIILKSLIQ